MGGIGEDGEVRRCEKEKHILCKACCNLTEDGEVCPLCDSGIMGQHNVLEQVLALMSLSFHHDLAIAEQESNSFMFTPNQKAEQAGSLELKKKEEGEGEMEVVQRRKREKKEKGKGPSTISTMILTSEGEEQWDEVKIKRKSSPQLRKAERE